LHDIVMDRIHGGIDRNPHLQLVENSSS
jgi:hypothetical protein